MAKKEFLHTWIRDKKNNTIGVVVARLINDEEVGLSYSLCHSKLDKFNKDRGLEIALGRARAIVEKDTVYIGKLYDDKKDLVTRHLKKMYKRANVYFKDCLIIYHYPMKKE